MRYWPGLRSEYACLPPHDGETVTRPGQIGIAFTGHHRLVYDTGAGSRTGDIRPGSTVVSGAATIRWLRVRETTEALEIYPDPAFVAAVADRTASRPVHIEPVVGRPDATVLGIGSILRRVHAGGSDLSDVAACTLAHLLVTHLLERYAGIRPARPDPGRLSAAVTDSVAALIDARLGTKLTLDELAAVARLSPYHFARAFKRTTGLAPHAFVTSRRMDRARNLLRTSAQPVDTIAGMVGIANLSHFRRLFRRHHGVPPSALRR